MWHLISPCKDCEKRYLGCHSGCPEYKQFKDSIDIARENKRKEQIINSHEYDVGLEKMKKYKYKYGIKRR